jgi:processive 1,2-diacylglycerol beta-glucosyltransferase
MRLLIISTAAGTGHVQAAAALEEAARRSRPDVEVHNVDALDYGTPLLRDLYAASYVLMANRFPALWGFLYERCESDTPRPRSSRMLGRLDRLNARPLVALTRRLRPDRILCTHFLPVSALGDATRAPIDVVVTDFDVHSFWIQPGVRRFHVAAESVRTILERKGIDRGRASVHGIPISDRFRDPPSREGARAELGIPTDRPVVLAMGGGFGRRGLLDVVEATVGASGEAVVLAVAGRNETMRAALVRRFGGDPRVRVFRFVRRIESLMSACDVLVTKPGGLTTSESLAIGRPMLLTAPVPGQEERNARHLVATGAARTAVTPEALRTEVANLLADPTRLAVMAATARAAGRPRAAEHIVAETLA